ncbi:MAG: YfcE family phosphodiesterase [candidate division KSB1 bacterium]|nr:YfcE family phosphodiesterase [candidate division KSB1 bacterium]
MGKIGLLSDTHGSLHPRVYDLFEGVELILHAGDVESSTVLSDLEVLAPVLAVRGNMDRSLTLLALPTFRLVHWAGRAIALVHNLEHLPEELARRSLQDEAIDVVVFGHTHVARSWWEGKRLYVNPGAAKAGSQRASVAVLWVDEHEVRAEHHALG